MEVQDLINTVERCGVPLCGTGGGKEGKGWSEKRMTLCPLQYKL